MNDKQLMDLISKPAILPKGVTNMDSFKQALNYYHKIMVKRIERLHPK